MADAAIADRLEGWFVVPTPTRAVHAVVARYVTQDFVDYPAVMLEFVCHAVSDDHLWRVPTSELLGGPLEASAPMCTQCHARLWREKANA